MREILFHGKRIDNGEWVEGDFYHRIVHIDTFHQNTVVSAIEVFDGDNPLSIAYYTVDPKTVGQFTGLIVKEKRLFEHDIVSVQLNGEEVYRFSVAFGNCGGASNVRHAVGYMGFYFEPANNETRHCVNAGLRCDPVYFINDYSYECEVIGNIHDNPELLEG